MKKCMYAITIISAAGSLVSGMLLLNHYYPDSGFQLLCGGGFENSCLALSISGYSTVFGIPIASWGLLFYLAVLFASLIADYAGVDYVRALAAFLLPFSAAALVADLALASILVIIGKFCSLCVVTYVLNILLFGAALYLYRIVKPAGERPLIKLFRETGNFLNETASTRASAASFILFVFLLAFSVFSTSYILRLKTMKQEISKSEIASFVKNFYESKKEVFPLPESAMALGDPNGVKITAFTDFLCSYCYKFFQVEKRLFVKYGKKISISYYHYPLDSACNSSVTRTLYKNSCIASRAVHAAGKLGILKEYLLSHFEDYGRIHSAYDDAVSLDVLRKASHDSIGMNKFIEIMNSRDTGDTIARHIDAARANNINATPTLIIAGRKISGLPPVEFLEAIIDSELMAGKK